MPQLNTYRLYVGAPVGRWELLEQLEKHDLHGATSWSATGVWRGSLEESTVIEIIGEDVLAPNVYQLSQSLAAAWNQSCVLMTTTPCFAELVTVPKID